MCDKIPSAIEMWLSLGTFPSAAGGGNSEEQGVAVTCRLASCRGNDGRGLVTTGRAPRRGTYAASFGGKLTN